MRREFLTQRVSILLERYSPPRAIQKNAEAQRQEVDAILRVVGAQMPTRAYEDWWVQFEDRLLTTHQTRAWPTIAEFKKAAMGGGSKPDTDVSEAKARDLAVLYVGEKRKPHPAFNTPEITAICIERGILADIREARWLGFDLTPEQFAEAIHLPSGEDEWKHHVRVIARLRGQSYGEAEAQEIREIQNRNQLPLRFQRGAA